MYKLPFFLLCPKPAPAVSKQGFLVGYPEAVKRLDFRPTAYGNDGLKLYFINRH